MFFVRSFSYALFYGGYIVLVIIVDYENVNEKGLTGLEKLKQTDRLILFYNNSSKISIDKLISISKLNIKMDYFKVTTTAKNSLDFQLISYLGYLIANDSESNYFIISNDTGFDSAVAFWKARNVAICRKGNIQNCKQTNTEQVPSKVTQSDVENLFKANPLPNVNIQQLTSYINKYKTKQGLNNALVKTYGNEKTSAINKIIKPLTKNKKGK